MLQQRRNSFKQKSEFISFEELKSYLKESQNKLELKLKSLESLESLDPAIINDVSGLSFHEIYHSGQFGYLRRILGKPGAVK